MAQPYLDSAGNVNPAIVNDLNNWALAAAQAAAVPTAGTQATLAATSAQVGTDAITGLPAAGNIITP